MEQIEHFFDFLKTHINEEFNHKKYTYTIEYYQYYHHYGDFDYRTNEFRVPNPDGFEIKKIGESGFYLVLEEFASGEYFCIQLNPNLQEIKKINEYLDSNEKKHFRETEYISLFDELDILYTKKCNNFFTDLTKFMMYVSSDNYSLRIKTLLDRLKNFENQADSPDYYVVSKKHESDYSLLSIHLKQLIEKINNSFLQERMKSLEESNNSIDGSTTVLNKNAFNSMDISMVKEYFEQLTNTKSRNDNPFLTQDQLDTFIQIAFIDCKKSNLQYNKIRMNFDKRGDIATIRKIFYDYYLKSREYESTNFVKPKYVKLLTDYFEGFDYDKIFQNFNKG